MGDRANIRLDEEQGSIHLYTHWSGEEWPEALRKALIAARSRWDDEPYRNRIIAREVFEGLDGTTGGGISIQLGDGDDRVVAVHGNVVFDATNDGLTWSLEQYIAAEPMTWERLRQGPNQA